MYTSLTSQLLVPAFVLEGFLWLDVPGNAGPSTLTQEQPSTKDWQRAGGEVTLRGVGPMLCPKGLQ